MKLLKFVFFLVILFALSATPTLSKNDSLEGWISTIQIGMAKIKSRGDLHYLNGNEAWLKLTSTSKDLFKSSLKFGENGLSSFNFEILELELSVSEIYSILTLFGQQHLASEMNNAHVVSDLDRLILSKPKLNGDNLSTSSLDDGVISIGGDHKGYYCESKGTCRESQGAICTSNC